ncbi:MAG: Beta-glucosidase [Caulobacter sp.]|nr:Beta-glucosidase [Caulobacter sp.]
MNKTNLRGAMLALMLGTASVAGIANAQVTTRPWADPKLSADQRADLLVKAMTQDEKLTLVYGYFGSPQTQPKFHPPAEARMGSAGYVPGIARLGLPPQWETDAGVGVATQRDSTDPYRERTSLPSGIATAATWNPDLAHKGGAMIGSEARDSGFNVMLAGGVNLLREPRNGRNFEYAGEDPLLAGTMVGAQIAGIQSNHIISTVKHYAFNNQETGRMVLSANIADDQARMSDLLAFEFAIEHADPGSVMCAYNRINGVYACENDYLLNQVLKTDWAYKGYVMSDWGGVHSTVDAANHGLDQESAGESFDKQKFFEGPLKAAVAAGQVPQARLDDMARRIVRAMVAHGVVDHPVTIKPIDFTANAKVTQADAEEAIVLLKNDKALLPLAKTAKKIAVIGSHADVGVMAGGGSSTVTPVGGNAVSGLGPKGFPGPIVYHPSSPLKAIQARNPGAQVRYADGTDPAAAAKLAADSDLVVVFAHQWAAEALDASLTLTDGQDALIAAVAAANPKTVVVLETGGPVLMPWLDKVGAVLEAWYPGTRGGEAIARVLYGEVDASGRLPATFPASLDQLPYPKLPGQDVAKDTRFEVDYAEGAAVGYKWYDLKGHTPLFPFGHGLSYTSFAYGGLTAQARNGTVTVSFQVKNIGARAGKAVPQVYVGPQIATGAGGWEAPRRLAGWKKLALAPGASQTVTLTVDPRLLATFDSKTKTWIVAPGDYQVSLGASSRDLKAQVPVTVAARTLPVSYDGK